MKNKLFTSIILISSLNFILFSQSHMSTQGHQESISMLVTSNNLESLDNSYYSIGKDGFLVKWDSDNIGEHYQITDLEIKMAAVSPNNKEIAVYETDGGSINRISVWNWETLSRKYARRFSDSITSLSYSSKGNYIIVGTATVDGAVFLNSSSGSVINKISDSTGIVNYAETSSSEKTAVMYSPAGSLSYYNLSNGRLKKKFKTIQGLTQTVLFNNSLYLAGVEGNNIYICHALSGKILKVINSSSPVILTSRTDENFYYLENDDKGLYTLYMLENQENQGLSTPRIIKTLKGPRRSESISCGIKIGNNIMCGTKAGAVYKTNCEPETESTIFPILTENTCSKILDMSPIGEDFYFLTKSAVYKSSYDTGIVNRVGDNPNYTKIITYGDKLIMWSKGTRDDVMLYDYSKPEMTSLFTPKSSLQSLRLFGNTLVEMESNSVVNMYDMESRKLTEAYTGAGLQDAIIGSDGKLYVAKSYATNPKSALLCVDIETKETVPLNLPGNVAYALSVHNNDIYGINIISENSVKLTSVFKYNIISKSTNTLLRFKDEDSDALTYLRYPFLYTNIGKDTIRSYNLTESKNFAFRRSASLPEKVCQNASRVVILNKDGSISWYNSDRAPVLADWYLTSDGQWFEY
ncbi:MAG: WD40 repeat domain-containing protein [Treponema sp.]|nr:WD40 repeat domain-containing protein [Treponema sp.]